MLTDDSFRVTDADVRFEGLRHADEAEVRARLTDLDRGPNVFRVRATDIVAELSTLTEVDAAVATVTLPAGVVVYLDEREPLFVWSDGERSWMVDEEGMLFAPADVVEGETTDTGAADGNAEAEIAGADAAGPGTGEPADPRTSRP